MPLEFSLRLATAEDLESIQRVYSYVIGPPTGQERTWSRLVAVGCMVVAEVEGQIAGFGGIDSDAVEQLKWLYVMPEYQGAGVGTAILKRLEEIGWSRGLGAIGCTLRRERSCFTGDTDTGKWNVTMWHTIMKA